MFSFFTRKSSKKENFVSTAFPVSDFFVGAHEEKGRRPTMEDKVCAVDLDPEGGLGLGAAVGRACFFAVFDGHGGSETSAVLENSLQAQVGKNLSSIIKDYTPGEDGDSLVKTALSSSFESVDAEICKESFTSGSTATTVLIMGNRVYCANIGDSRVVLSRAGKAIDLSEDHKPTRPDEKERIKKSGGFVMNGRVLGELAVSRAFGDKKFKDLDELTEMVRIDEDSDLKVEEPLVSSVPVIETETLCEQDEFILLACDGLYDVMTSQQAIDFVRKELAAHGDPSRAAKAATKEAVYTKGSMDNVSIVVVRILEKMPDLPPPVPEAETPAAAESAAETEKADTPPPAP